MDWIPDPGLRTGSLTQSFRIHFVPSGRAPGYLLFVFVVPVFIPHLELGERLVK